MAKCKEAVVLIDGKKVLVTVQALSKSASQSKVIMLDELNTWVQREAVIAR